jgi:hypothetical protein
VVPPYYLFCVEKRVCLSRDVQVIGAAWRAAMRIEVGVGDSMQRTRDGQAQVEQLLCSLCRDIFRGRRRHVILVPKLFGRYDNYV